MAIESPRYTVISKSPVYEIRQYEPYILAQVKSIQVSTML